MVTGRVQGVGFRPFVYQLATELGLTGQVQNNDQGVLIDLRGDSSALKQFQSRLRTDMPAAASIDSIDDLSVGGASSKEQSFEGFRILNSEVSPTYRSNILSSAQIPADLPVCRKCLQELFDPTDRRYQYPFINCTQCGPRYTLIQSLPYDRSRTSMKGFELCDACHHEYQSVSSRRFHAQPNACADCGPTLSLVDNHGVPMSLAACSGSAGNVLSEIVSLINQGYILAIKGLGGFHLVCDARQPDAVNRLRQRKRRPDKPFAVMGLNTASLEQVVRMDAQVAECLQTDVRPVVLSAKTAVCDLQLELVAPQLADLGVMLPYTPLHYLLYHEAAGRPAGLEWLDAPHPWLLVMTSANQSGAPLVHTNDQCVEQLSDIADYFVLHDRDIVTRCDDSVVQAGVAQKGVEQASIRRARGWVPQPVRLPEAGPSVLACGGYLKNTFCLTRGNLAYLSPHIGDLDHPDTCQWFQEAIRHMSELTGVKPQAVACDGHPDFFSSRFAERYAEEQGVPLFRVLHHHAHLAAVMAEQGVTGAVLGLTLDGVGLGEDRQVWGGEMFYGDCARLERIGHFSELSLPGGDVAARDIWRLGAGVLWSMGMREVARKKFGNRPIYSSVEGMMENSSFSPLTSSAGRWFDAIAAILGICEDVSFEGQAPMLLESAAAGIPWPEPQGLVVVDSSGLLDIYPLIRHLVQFADSTEAAAVFHAELSDGLVRWCVMQAEIYQTRRVVAAGGCFMNRLLRKALRDGLARYGMTLYLADNVPCNDGGISLGQAWIALSRLNQAESGIQE